VSRIEPACRPACPAANAPSQRRPDVWCDDGAALRHRI